MNWQPIETAPRGTSVLLLYNKPFKHIESGEWDGEDRHWSTLLSKLCYEYGDEEPVPTHWMPLPKMPHPAV